MSSGSPVETQRNTHVSLKEDIKFSLEEEYLFHILKDRDEFAKQIRNEAFSIFEKEHVHCW